MKANISKIALEFTPEEIEKLREELDQVLSIPAANTGHSVKEILTGYPTINALLHELQVDGLPF